MAGNIVKWWKHKILGGYKQFSVQECTTDSEELMYHQVRASSSCSAPPDLLLVSERDNNIQLRSPVVNIITTPPGNASGSASKHLPSHSQAPHSNHHNSGRHQSGNPHPQDVSSGGSHSKHLRISSGSNGRHGGKYSNMQQQAPQDEDVVDAAAAMTQQHGGGTHTHSRHLHHNKEERIRLEEFTCDVSVEGGKSSQPLQFSFTFYDLDGHHGKITKDDIVGIVYTIYESIGKSVVVPHCGSKTINVRLTVSPEGKSKAQPVPNAGAGAGAGTGFGSSKLKKLPTGLAAMSKTVAGAGGGGAGGATGTSALTTSAGSRRQHRYRPRKLIKSDDEDDDSNSEKDALPSAEQQASGSGGKAGGKTGHHHQTRYHQKNNTRPEPCCPEQHTPDNGHNTYENMLNLKCCKPESSDRDRDVVDCPAAAAQRQHHLHNHSHHQQQQQQQQQRQQDIYMKQATQRVKMLRRARKQKYQDHCLETRQRSLSVGNDSAWQNRHLQQQPQAMQAVVTATPAQPVNHKSASVSPPLGGGGGELMLDGVQLRQPRPQSLTHHQHQQQQQQQQRKSAECWKSALNRNDLISIIRESMEKNRLCFQLNGKPQANVSPIRQPAAQQQQPQQQQRQRCNTGSKIPTLIASHSPVAQQSPLSCSPPTADTTCIPVAPASNEVSVGHQQQQQHLQQQQHHSHHEHPQPHIPIYHQQLAINPAVLAAQQTHNTAHNKLNLCGYDSFLHATICGGGAAAHSPPPTPSNVATVQPIPKKNQKNLLQGYQRLDQQQQQQQQKEQKEQKEQRSSKDYRNYGNLIYAKLSEQLQQKEREQRRHRHHKQQQQQNQLLPEKQHKEPEQADQRPPTSNSSSAGSKIYGDALECAHLLASEEEDLPPSPQLTSTPSKVVSTDTLIDLNDDVGEAVAEAVTEGGKQSLEADEGQAQEVELDTSASSSMIHRYVHEHIHHHYHHFKEQQDV